MNRKMLLTLVIAISVALAGCGSGDSPSADNANDGNNGGDNPGGDNPDGGSGNGGTGDGGMVDFFQFDQPARYVYDVNFDGDTGQVVWDVKSVEGNKITVYVSYDVGGDTYESTITGTKENIQGQLLYTPAGTFMMLGMFSPMFGYYDGKELYVGKTWSYTAPDGSGSMSFEVTGTKTYAGVECYDSQLKINQSVIQEACFSPDLGLAAYTAWYDEDTGDTSMRMELVEYERK